MQPQRTSQSLRKSGQFLWKKYLEDKVNLRASRNPFVNQVSFFKFSGNFLKNIKVQRSRNPFVNQVSFFA